jgi:hypothetical protein
MDRLQDSTKHARAGSQHCRLPELESEAKHTIDRMDDERR